MTKNSQNNSGYKRKRLQSLSSDNSSGHSPASVKEEMKPVQVTTTTRTGTEQTKLDQN
jgi:hypothetical protein